MTHTLGPWRIAGPCPTNAVSFNIRADNHSEGSGALLFTTGPMFHDYDIDPKEAEANARLAAAAPELLTALQAIVDRAADPAADENEDAIEVTLAFICQTGRAAIAKAKQIEGERESY